MDGLEEEEWKELWRIFEGQDYKEYHKIMKRMNPVERMEQCIPLKIPVLLPNMHHYCIYALVVTLFGMQMFPQLHDWVHTVRIAPFDSYP